MTVSSASPLLFDRRTLLKGALACGAAPGRASRAQPAAPRQPPDIDATFVFASDVHACRMGSGLSPHCAAEGKTDENLRRHIAAINRLPELRWPAESAAAAPVSPPPEPGSAGCWAW